MNNLPLWQVIMAKLCYSTANMPNNDDPSTAGCTACRVSIHSNEFAQKIAKENKLNSNTVYRVLKFLEQMGYIKRGIFLNTNFTRRMPRINLRNKTIVLTEKGKEVAKLCYHLLLIYNESLKSKASDQASNQF